MTLNFAHCRDQAIDFVVFDADARTHLNADREELLRNLTVRVRLNGLSIDKSALAYRKGSRMEYCGTPDLVRYLAQSGLPRWTHSMSV